MYGALGLPFHVQVPRAASDIERQAKQEGGKENVIKWVKYDLYDFAYKENKLATLSFFPFLIFLIFFIKKIRPLSLRVVAT